MAPTRNDDEIIAATAAAVAGRRASSRIETDLSEIALEGARNAATEAIGSLRDGRLRAVGFATADGYLQAIRRGVPASTHAAYLQTLRDRFHRTSAELDGLPGPAVQATLPVGPGIRHVPAGVPLFDRPRSERRFVVGGGPPSSASAPTAVRAAAPPTPPRPPTAATGVVGTTLLPRRQQFARILAGSSPVRRRTPPSPPLPPMTGPGPAPALAPSTPPARQARAEDLPGRPGAARGTPPGRAARSEETTRDTGDDAADRFALLEFD